MDEPRTEQATAAKLARARREGSVPKSPDLMAAASVLALVGALAWQGDQLLQGLRQLVLRALLAAGEPGAPVLQALAEPVRDLGWRLLVVMSSVAFAAWLAGLLQVGPLLAFAAVAPRPQRVDPLNRLRDLFSGERVLELGWTGVRASALLGVVAWCLLRDMRALTSMLSGSASRALSTLLVCATDLALRVAIAAALLGALDLVYRRVRHLRQLRMGRRELALELRESYGLPEHRERRRRLQQEALAQTALADVERANVLLLGAGGRAIALAFDQGDSSQGAPRVVAKAQGSSVPRLQLRAQEHAIPVRWHEGLVAALFRLELTEEVPSPCYDEVAAVFRELGREPS